MTGILCAIALSGHIPLVYPLLLLAAMGLSVYLDLKQIHIPRWLLTVLSFAVLLYFFVRFDMEDLIGQIMEILHGFSPLVSTKGRNGFMKGRLKTTLSMKL